jgi:hypothetical protein
VNHSASDKEARVRRRMRGRRRRKVFQSIAMNEEEEAVMGLGFRGREGVS